MTVWNGGDTEDSMKRIRLLALADVVAAPLVSFICAIPLRCCFCPETISHVSFESDVNEIYVSFGMRHICWHIFLYYILDDIVLADHVAELWAISVYQPLSVVACHDVERLSAADDDG